ncbi:MAG: RHS repeat protein, partial [Firmicutes bacterium]|nr:RHS repeat protein [Bacillota bacterium]
MNNTPAITGKAVTGKTITGVMTANINAFNDRSHEPSLTHSNGSSNLTTYLKSGVFNLEITSAAFGSGPLTTSFMHIYNSMLDTDILYITNDNRTIRSHMGNGFKLNLQQFLFPIANGGAINNDPIRYHYIDSIGTRHNIVQNGNVFYDTSGLGLVLDTSQNGFPFNGTTNATTINRLMDRQGNMLFFDNLGRLIATRSVFGSSNTFDYDGDSVRLISVTTASVSRHADGSGDSIQTSKTARLFYNTINLLDRIEYDERYNAQGVRITDNNPIAIFNYEGNRLISIFNTILVSGTQKKRLISEFVYQDDIIHKAIDIGGHVLTIKMFDKKVSQICEGTSIVRRHDRIEYTSNNKTKVINNKDVCVVYNYDNDGETFSIYEEVNDNYRLAIDPEPDGFGYNQYLPTELSDGRWRGMRRAAPADSVENLSLKRITDDWFNQKRVIEINGTAGSESYIVADVLEATEMNRDDRTVGNQTFTLSCWVKANLNRAKSGHQRLEFEVVYRDDSVQLFSENIDTKQNDWQLAAFSFMIRNSEVRSARARIFNNNTSEPLFVSDIRMVQGGIAEQEITVQYRNLASGLPGMLPTLNINIPLSDMQEIILRINNNDVVVPINENTEFSFMDAEQTRKNHFLAGSNPYSISLNNGKRLISNVLSMMFISRTSNILLQPISGHILGARTRQISGIHDEITINSATSYSIHNNKNIVTTTTQANRGKEQLSEESMQVGFNGLPISKTDSHGVTTTYNYDAFGNLVQAQMRGAGNNAPTCQLNTDFQTNGEHPKNSWDTRHSRPLGRNANDAIATNFSSPSSTLSSVTKPLQANANQRIATLLGYDEFKERLTSIQTTQSAQNNAINQNDIKYRSDGKLQTVTHNNGNVSYNFGYDIYGNINNIPELGLNKTYNYISNGTSVTTEYDNGHSQQELIDKHGFNLSTSVRNPNNRYISAVSTTFRDKDRVTISHASKVRQINDSFDNTNTIFKYNQNEEMMGYVKNTEISRSENRSIRVEVSEEDNEVGVDGLEAGGQYSMTVGDVETGNLVRTMTQRSRRWTDRNILKPKLRRTSASMGTTLMTTTDYNYDRLGRPTTIRRHMSVRAPWNNFARTYNSSLTYLSNPALANGTTDYISAHTNGELTFGYTYNASGQINRVTTTGRQSNNQVNTYTYDGQNRLRTHTQGITKTTYTYDAGGNIRSTRTEPTAAPDGASITPVVVNFSYEDESTPDRL